MCQQVLGRLYTVGHSTHTVEHFASLVQTHGVTHVVDVRSMPYSQHVPQFNKESLDRFLGARGITYLHMGHAFGARQEDERLYCEEGYLDFERVRATPRFQASRDNVIKGLGDGKSIAFMCAERDPIDCHRTIMVARGFELVGVPVAHILSDGTLETQAHLNERLLDLYFPDRHQMSLFDVESDDELLESAYRMRNEKIGYRMRRADGGL